MYRIAKSPLLGGDLLLGEKIATNNCLHWEEIDELDLFLQEGNVLAISFPQRRKILNLIPLEQIHH